MKQDQNQSEPSESVAEAADEVVAEEPGAPAPEANPPADVEYPSKQQEHAVRIVECVSTIAALATAENAGAVRAAVDQIRREAVVAAEEGWLAEASWARNAAELVLAHLRADEEAGLGVEAGDDEPDEQSDEEDGDEILDEPPVPAAPAA